MLSRKQAVNATLQIKITLKVSDFWRQASVDCYRNYLLQSIFLPVDLNQTGNRYRNSIKPGSLHAQFCFRRG